MGSERATPWWMARAASGESAAIYLLIFVTSVSQKTIVPLLPIVKRHYGLHPAAVACVLVLPSVAMLITATPVGVLGDRIGNRRVTVAAGLVLAAAVLAQAIPSLTALVLARLTFGVGYGALWTVGLARLAGLRSGGSSTRRLGATITASGVGSAIGPTVAGALASHFGFSASFVVAGAGTAGVAGLLAIVPHPTPAARGRPDPGAESLVSAPHPAGAHRRRSPLPGSTLAVLRRPAVLAGAVTLVLSSGVAALLQLLVPLQLGAIGRSPQQIGLVLSAGALVYIATSATCVHLAARITSLRAGSLLVALLGAALLPCVAGSTLLWVTAAVVCSALPRAALSTVAYAVATEDHRPVGPGPGPATVIGLLNSLSAIANVAVPVTAGAMVATAGPTWVYVGAVLVIAAAALRLHRNARSLPAATPAGAATLVPRP